MSDIKRFIDEEPDRAFLWVWHNKDGTRAEIRGDMSGYTKFKALYGLPQSAHWRYHTPTPEAKK